VRAEELERRDVAPGSVVVVVCTMAATRVAVAAEVVHFRS
jgi:hypothetical protein